MAQMTKNQRRNLRSTAKLFSKVESSDNPPRVDVLKAISILKSIQASCILAINTIQVEHDDAGKIIDKFKDKLK